MESLMSNLLASAAGKEDYRPPGVTSHFHSDSFIIPGEYRQEHPGEYRQEHTNVDEPVTPSREINFYTPSENNSPSYVPFYDVSGYSSSPTFVRGDFYNISPPVSPEVSGTKTPSHHEQILSFSIDSILGLETSDLKKSGSDIPAHVYRDTTMSRTPCSSGQFRFSMTDWSSFQNRTHTTVSRNGNTFWCHVCDVTCSTVEVATSHQMAHVKKGDHCKLQRKHFAGHGYVSTHEETEYLNRIKCGMCGKIVTKCFFAKHLRRHDGHVCDVCGHEASTNGLLLSHMKNHSGLNYYSCRICNRKFGTKDILKTHELSHRKGGHQCRFCGKVFCSKYSRIVHERIHTGNNPFVCEMPGCNRSFPQKVQLKIHQSTHL